MPSDTSHEYQTVEFKIAILFKKINTVLGGMIYTLMLNII